MKLTHRPSLLLLFALGSMSCLERQDLGRISLNTEDSTPDSGFDPTPTDPDGGPSIGPPSEPPAIEPNRPPSRTRPVGFPCEQPSQCEGGDGLCLSAAALDGTFPGGYCSYDCTNRPCPGDSVCVFEVSGISLCLDRCERNSDCRTLYECASDGRGGGVCQPSTGGCRVDEDCPGRCDSSTSRCVECLEAQDCPADETCSGNVCVGLGAVGSACADGGDCFGRSCVPNNTAPGGYCTQYCATDSDCTAGGHCGVFGECRQSCADASDCRPGYACVDFDGDFLRECWAIGAGAGPVGSSCDTVADCQGDSAAVCVAGVAAPSSAGGVCSQYCTPSGISNSSSTQTVNAGPCPSGSSCLEFWSGWFGYCLQECQTDADCPSAGQACTPLASGGGSVCARAEP